ncbi:MAG TPA: HAMP domain-containing sensor histidine kinase [Solirubrobacteraceae bacterium]
MSFAPNLIEFPNGRGHRGRDSLSWDLLDAVALADGAASGMRRVVDRVRREAGAAGVEWWGTGEDGTFTRIVTSGTGRGERVSVSLGRAGVLVIHGGRLSAALESALSEVAPVIRGRVNEEHLARAAASLARRNEALDEFAAVVAHELKLPLQAALAAENPTALIYEALDLVDVLLTAAQTAPVGEASTDVGGCLDRAVGSLGRQIRVTSDVPVPVPVPPGPLFVILRNLLSNAASAGATSVHVKSERSYRCLRLLVEDDGAGLGARDRYATGSRLGLPLCRQIAARSGGVLELSPRVPNGSRATLTFGLVEA